MYQYVECCFFFFSSRRRHTRCSRDWSSDVCSSDLDTDDYEWTGYIPFEQLPQALNPESGFIATANARVVGPNYKPYLTDRWEEPYRKIGRASCRERV